MPPRPGPRGLTLAQALIAPLKQWASGLTPFWSLSLLATIMSSRMDTARFQSIASPRHRIRFEYVHTSGLKPSSLIRPFVTRCRRQAGIDYAPSDPIKAGGERDGGETAATGNRGDVERVPLREHSPCGGLKAIRLKNKGIYHTTTG